MSRVLLQLNILCDMPSRILQLDLCTLRVTHNDFLLFYIPELYVALTLCYKLVSFYTNHGWTRPMY